MSTQKTLDKILAGNADVNVRFEELCALLTAKGFRMRSEGSHFIFSCAGVRERINLQREGSKAKPYRVRQVRKVLISHKIV